MVDPVLIAETGHSYERCAIARWLAQHETESNQSQGVRDPKTNMLLQVPIQLVTNHTLRLCINESTNCQKIECQLEGVNTGMSELSNSYRAARKTFKEELPNIRKGQKLIPQLLKDLDDAKKSLTDSKNMACG